MRAIASHIIDTSLVLQLDRESGREAYMRIEFSLFYAS